MFSIIGGQWQRRGFIDGRPAWYGPKVPTFGVLDMSSLREQAEANSGRGNGLWLIRTEDASRLRGEDYLTLATGPTVNAAINSAISVRMRKMFASLFPVPRQVISSVAISDMLWRALTAEAQPVSYGCGTLAPDENNRLRLNFGGWSRSVFVSADSELLHCWRSQARANALRHQQKYGSDLASKVLTFSAMRWNHGRIDGLDSHPLFRSMPDAIRPTMPATVVTEDWSDLNDFTTVTGSFNVSGNLLMASGMGVNKGYLDTAVSSADHSVDSTGSVASSDAYVISNARYEDDDNYYHAQCSRTGARRFAKTVGSTFTVIATGSAITLDSEKQFSIKSVGSTHTLKYDSTQWHESTDTALTAGLKCGVAINGTSSYMKTVTFQDEAGGGGGSGSNCIRKSPVSLSIGIGL